LLVGIKANSPNDSLSNLTQQAVAADILNQLVLKKE